MLYINTQQWIREAKRREKNNFFPQIKIHSEISFFCLPAPPMEKNLLLLLLYIYFFIFIIHFTFSYLYMFYTFFLYTLLPLRNISHTLCRVSESEMREKEEIFFEYQQKKKTEFFLQLPLTSSYSE